MKKVVTSKVDRQKLVNWKQAAQMLELSGSEDDWLALFRELKNRYGLPLGEIRIMDRPLTVFKLGDYMDALGRKSRGQAVGRAGSPRSQPIPLLSNDPRGAKDLRKRMKAINGKAKAKVSLGGANANQSETISPELRTRVLEEIRKRVPDDEIASARQYCEKAGINTSSPSAFLGNLRRRAGGVMSVGGNGVGLYRAGDITERLSPRQLNNQARRYGLV